jgi:GT2 family glycosyltransferase
VVPEAQKDGSFLALERTPDPRNMTFSVVIPTCERSEDLARCLDRLAPGVQTCDGALYEVIVSDDGRTGESRRMVEDRFPWVFWRQGPRRGPAANRNNGAAAAKGEWLVFVDDDCLPEPGLLEGYARAISDFPGVHVFEGKTVPLGNRQRLDERCPENQTGGKLWSCNFAIKLKTFVSVGRFDCGFPFAAFEDIEFGIRLQKAGIKIAFCENATVCHPWRKDKGFKFWFYAMDSLVFLLKKHPDQRKNFTIISNLKILVGIFYKNFIPEYIAMKGKGAFREISITIFIFLFKIYKVNFLSNFQR